MHHKPIHQSHLARKALSLQGLRSDFSSPAGLDRRQPPGNQAVRGQIRNWHWIATSQRSPVIRHFRSMASRTCSNQAAQGNHRYHPVPDAGVHGNRCEIAIRRNRSVVWSPTSEQLGHRIPEGLLQQNLPGDTSSACRIANWSGAWPWTAQALQRRSIHELPFYRPVSSPTSSTSSRWPMMLSPLVRPRSGKSASLKRAS